MSNDAEMKKKEDSFSKSLGNIVEQDGRGLREYRIRDDPHTLICWLDFFLFFSFLRMVTPEYVYKQKKRNYWRGRGERCKR